MKGFRRMLVISVVVLPSMTFAQDVDELARQTQNPVSSLISFPLQANWDFGLGDRETTATLLNIQPVAPIAASEGTNIILRVIMPMASQPGAGSARGANDRSDANQAARAGDSAWSRPFFSRADPCHGMS